MCYVTRNTTIPSRALNRDRMFLGQGRILVSMQYCFLNYFRRDVLRGELRKNQTRYIVNEILVVYKNYIENLKDVYKLL